jgi:hypothetical protein
MLPDKGEDAVDKVPLAVRGVTDPPFGSELRIDQASGTKIAQNARSQV